MNPLVLLGVLLTALVLFIIWLLQPTKGKSKAQIRKAKFPVGEDRWVEEMKKVPVTGQSYLIVGSGFLGKSLIRALIERGEKRVRAFDIAPLKNWELADKVEFILGDISNAEQVREATKGVDVVFHTAAMICYYERLPFLLPRSEKVNVKGTENVIAACLKENAKILVYTSSSHVVLTRGFKKIDAPDDLPYVTKDTAVNNYALTKALAEQAVLKANRSHTENDEILYTAAIRPGGIYGGGDGALWNLHALWETGWVMTAPQWKQDCVYVHNLVLAHLCLEAKMQEVAIERNPKNWGPSEMKTLSCTGTSYHIADIYPAADTEDFVNVMNEFHPLKISFAPTRLVYLLGLIVETVQRIFPKKDMRRMFGDLIHVQPAYWEMVTQDNSFSSKKAQDKLGFNPAYTLEQALSREVNEYKKQKKSS